MKQQAKRKLELRIESFADMVWAVPLNGAAPAEPNGRLLHRAESHSRRGPRIILLRGFSDGEAPSLLAL